MLICHCLSGVNLSDEDAFSDTLEDVVTSVKRNGVAMKGTVRKIYYQDLLSIITVSTVYYRILISCMSFYVICCS